MWCLGVNAASLKLAMHLPHRATFLFSDAMERNSLRVNNRQFEAAIQKYYTLLNLFTLTSQNRFDEILKIITVNRLGPLDAIERYSDVALRPF